MTQGSLNCGMMVLARAVPGHWDIGTEGGLSPTTLLPVTLLSPGSSRMRVYDGSFIHSWLWGTLRGPRLASLWFLFPSAPWLFIC